MMIVMIMIRRTGGIIPVGRLKINERELAPRKNKSPPRREGF
jgi:hypothetical protein